MEGYKDGIYANVGRDPHPESGAGTTRTQPHHPAILQAVASGGAGMDFRHRLRRHPVERKRAPGLCARLIVCQNASGRQVEGVIGVRLLRRLLMTDRVEARPTTA